MELHSYCSNQCDNYATVLLYDFAHRGILYKLSNRTLTFPDNYILTPKFIDFATIRFRHLCSMFFSQAHTIILLPKTDMIIMFDLTYIVLLFKVNIL